MSSNEFTCKCYRSKFCYVCSQSVKPEDRIEIDETIKKNYKICFQIDLNQYDHTPNVVCRICKNRLRTTAQNGGKSFPFKSPAKWFTPKSDHSNCFFCLIEQMEKSLEKSSLLKPVPQQFDDHTVLTFTSSVENIIKSGTKRKRIESTNKATNMKGRKKNVGIRSKRIKSISYLNDNPNDSGNNADLDDTEETDTCSTVSNSRSSIKFYTNPKLIDQKSLDELAIKLKADQDDDEIIIFKHNPKKIEFKDLCIIPLIRIDKYMNLNVTVPDLNQLFDDQDEIENDEHNKIEKDEPDETDLNYKEDDKLDETYVNYKENDKVDLKKDQKEEEMIEGTDSDHTTEIDVNYKEDDKLDETYVNYKEDDKVDVKKDEKEEEIVEGTDSDHTTERMHNLNLAEFESDDDDSNIVNSLIRKELIIQYTTEDEKSDDVDIQSKDNSENNSKEFNQIISNENESNKFMITDMIEKNLAALEETTNDQQLKQFENVND